MINRDRVLKLLGDFKEWESDFKECIDSLEKCDNQIKKLLYHSVRAYFLDFHHITKKQNGGFHSVSFYYKVTIIKVL